ncbi:hypothetical protein DPMN_189502 [Dreissena polymorpha]|uniref:Uncharacterized protein n=1 Tax=Dreissena polymorpha TaxID=45954 RepID=A0A9D4DV02_DREPO|nr:hypothetical protein DPMN_189502 [Dreissena polymorpha]
MNSELIDEGNGDSVGLVSVLNKLADEMNKLSTFMNKLRKDVRDVNDKLEKVTADVNSKLEKVTEEMEKKLTHKIHNVIDTRFKNEQLKNKQDMEKEVHTLKDELSSYIACLQSQVHDINSKPQICRDLNVCIMNHAQTTNENVNQIVNDLLVDGLKLRHVDFRKAESKLVRIASQGSLL